LLIEEVIPSPVVVAGCVVVEELELLPQAANVTAATPINVADTNRLVDFMEAPISSAAPAAHSDPVGPNVAKP
jgi:hypothetical protein